jgi:hypothetical protein
MKQALAAAALLAVLLPVAASAHEIGTGRPTGFVATVASIRPNVLGVQAQVVLGDQLSIRNLSRGPVEILDRAGAPLIRIPPGGTRAWHDARVVGEGEPPPPAPGAPEGAPRFVKNWTVPGRAAGQAFEIDGFLGWVPPEENGNGATSPFLFGAGALVLVALSAVAVFLLGRRRV